MAARILITGKGGKSGSWAIRAVQLGEALGAEVQPMAEVSDCLDAGVVVVVKRTPPALIRNVVASGRPWVWDIVDAWPQPCTWGEVGAVEWLRWMIRELRPDGVVFGTERMQQDSGYNGPSLVLPHHAWPKYTPNPVRQSVEVVGYEGDPRYLGKWRQVVERECRARNWRFEVNGNMQHADIGLSLRDSGSYPAKWWKPGTKLANLQALGIPALCSPEAGSQMIANGTEFWIKGESDITAAFDQLDDVDTRSAIAAIQRGSVVRLDAAAKEYAAWLTTIR